MNLTKIITKKLDQKKDEPRAYIGASSIGNACDRAIWYGLHKPDKKIVTAKQRITFEIGHKLETMLIEMMVAAGLLITTPYVYACREYPMFQGNADAMLVDWTTKPICIIEIKTAKDASFRIFQTKGVRLWYPEYYDQMQSYMGMSGIHSATLIAINKDTSDLHDEKIQFDQERYQFLVKKAKRIGESESEPPRINQSPSFFRCKLCFYQKKCHGINNVSRETIARES